MIKLSISTRGDTIVEVLIAVAVVSSVLAITYATMNRNIIVGRRNQEQSEASKWGQAQVEALKNLASVDQNSIDTRGAAPFCIDNGTLVPLNGGVPNAGGLNNEDFSVYDARCNKGGSGNDMYHIGIKHDLSDNIYRIYVRWDRLGGGRQEVITVYRY